MRRLIVTFICGFLFCLSLIGQSAAGQEVKYSAKFLKYIRQIDQWQNATPEEVGISQQKYDLLLAKLHDCAAYELMLMKDLDNALMMYNVSVAYYEKAMDWGGTADGLRQTAFLNYYLDNIRQSFEDSERALVIAEELKDTSRLVEIAVSYTERLEEQNFHSRALELSDMISSFEKSDLSQESRLFLLRHNIEDACAKADFALADLYLEEYAYIVESVQDDPYNSIRCVYLLEKEERFRDEGRYEEAASCALTRAEYSVDDDSRLDAYASAMHDYASTGDRRSFDRYADSVSVMMNTLPMSTYAKINLHNMKAMSYNTIGMYEEAMKEYDAIAAISAGAVELDALKAGLLHKMGRNEESRQYYRSYTEKCLKNNGPQSLQYADAVRYLANSEGFCGDIAGGFSHYKEYLSLIRELLKSELPYVTSEKKDKFWSEMSEGVMHMASYSLAAGEDQGEFTRASYDGLLLSKGLLLSSERSVSDYIRSHADKTVQDVYYKVLSLRERLEKLKNNYTANKDSILVLSSDLSNLEIRLATECHDYTRQTAFLDVTYEGIRKKMNSKSVVIDFVDYKSETVGHRYIAYVYRKDWEFPKLIQVFTQDEMDALGIEEMHPEMLYSRKNSSDALKLLWEPLSQFVGEGDTVFFIPSGSMHMIALESLVMADGSHLGDRYNIVRLSSAREIVDGKPAKKKFKCAALFGGLKYDTNAVSIARSSYGFLPESAEEVDAVADMLEKSGVRKQLYKGDDGTVSTFIASCKPSPDILHIATHGFYYEPEKAVGVEGLSGYKNAMMLSGIVFSDAFMTAEEISGLDLSDTDIVVLTACDTGKGKITSEGVYGLQRAFKKAGVQTVIMSLWKTDDKAAKDFMQFFYNGLITKGWDKRKAFESARAEMRKVYRSPYYWGGFVMLD